MGEGPLEVRLGFDGARAALAGGESRFAQRLFSTDGTFRDVPVGGAEWHATHAHFHYAGLVDFRLHAFDVAFGVRGDLMREGHKAGFCFFDMGLVSPGAAGASVPRYASEANCAATPDEEWVTGISPGWFDRYGAALTDQYIEITGLADGVYELVATANGARTLLEAHPQTNEGSVVLRVTGDRVETLGPPRAHGD